MPDNSSSASAGPSSTRASRLRNNTTAAGSVQQLLNLIAVEREVGASDLPKATREPDTVERKREIMATGKHEQELIRLAREQTVEALQRALIADAVEIVQHEAHPSM